MSMAVLLAALLLLAALVLCAENELGTPAVNAITYPATNRLSSNTFMRLLEAYKS